MEEWRSVAGYAGAYEVSDCGRVRRADGLIKKAEADRAGYLRLSLWANGKATKFLVHRLVAAHFHGESDKQVNHKDGDKSNNHVANLEYVTARENIQHAIATGLRDFAGGKNARAKLSADQVRLIRTCEVAGTRLAKQFGVTKRVIYLVRRGESYKDTR